MAILDWFLTTAQRDNPWTVLSRRHPGHPEVTYTDGNEVRALIDGSAYFVALREALELTRAGDLVMFTDWRGDLDERLGPGGPPVGELLAQLAARGVLVKGLFWHSRWDRMASSEAENRTLARDIERAGGEVLLDLRVLPLGSHHQKFVVLRHPGRPELDTAFVGGIDLCHTRNDDSDHAGDPQAVRMGRVWGPTPPWHDVMLQVWGPAVGDVEASFRERWDDPTPRMLDPIELGRLALGSGGRGGPLPAQLPDPAARGTASVQVLRTYPPKVPPFPFAPLGERSIARGYEKAVGRATSLIYVEDQYFWGGEVVSCFARALAARPELRLIVVLPHHASQDGWLGRVSQAARAEALEEVLRAGPGRVGVYGLENPAGTPVYVHSKVCVVDDAWACVGSDNVNRRSWTHDSELSCAVHDPAGDTGEPSLVDDAGDGTRTFARDLRVRLAREHLDRAEGDDADLVDPLAAFEAFRSSAARLQAWYDGGRCGPRPPGRLRLYASPAVSGVDQLVGGVVARFAGDPDARPLPLQWFGRF